MLCLAVLCDDFEITAYSQAMDGFSMQSQTPHLVLLVIFTIGETKVKIRDLVFIKTLPIVDNIKAEGASLDQSYFYLRGTSVNSVFEQLNKPNPQKIV